MSKFLKIITPFLIAITFTACSFTKPNKIDESTKSTSTIQSDKETSITLPTIKETIDKLCSDELEGRLVGTKGNELAAEYIKGYFKNIKLDTFSDKDYCHKYSQPVFANYGKGDDKILNKEADNLVGLIKGTNSSRAVIISAHFDHIGYQDGKIIRGALDNASGVATLLDIAHKLKEKSLEKQFDMDILICSFNGEEFALKGSRAFVNDIKPKYKNLYNINIDCVGAKEGGKLALKNKSKVSNKLYDSMKATLKKNNIQFSDATVKGISDHVSFEDTKIPNFSFVQENVNKLVHKPTDVPDIFDSKEIENLSNAIVDFIQTNNGVVFN